jgi:hypothetical protein
MKITRADIISYAVFPMPDSLVVHVDGLNINNIPINPMAKPTMVLLLLKFAAQFGLSSNTNQIGGDNIIMATIALGKVCSAQITATRPITNKRKLLLPSE